MESAFIYAVRSSLDEAQIKQFEKNSSFKLRNANKEVTEDELKTLNMFRVSLKRRFSRELVKDGAEDDREKYIEEINKNLKVPNLELGSRGDFMSKLDHVRGTDGGVTLFSESHAKSGIGLFKKLVHRVRVQGHMFTNYTLTCSYSGIIPTDF